MIKEQLDAFQKHLGRNAPAPVEEFETFVQIEIVIHATETKPNGPSNGDLLREVRGRRVRSLREVETVVRTAKGPNVAKVLRNGREVEIVVPAQLSLFTRLRFVR